MIYSLISSYFFIVNLINIFNAYFILTKDYRYVNTGQIFTASTQNKNVPFYQNKNVTFWWNILKKSIDKGNSLLYRMIKYYKQEK